LQRCLPRKDQGRAFVNRQVIAAQILGLSVGNQGDGSAGETQGGVAENLSACPAIDSWQAGLVLPI
jgi:hypothetical protein